MAGLNAESTIMPISTYYLVLGMTIRIPKNQPPAEDGELCCAVSKKINRENCHPFILHHDIS